MLQRPTPQTSSQQLLVVPTAFRCTLSLDLLRLVLMSTHTFDLLVPDNYTDLD